MNQFENPSDATAGTTTLPHGGSVSHSASAATCSAADHAERFQLDYHTARRFGSSHHDAEDAAQNAALASLRHGGQYRTQNGGFKKNRAFWESRTIHRARTARARNERGAGLCNWRLRRFAQPEDLVIARDFCAWAKKQIGHRAVAEILLLLQHTRFAEAGGGARKMARDRGMTYGQLQAMRARGRRALRKLRRLIPQQDLE